MPRHSRILSSTKTYHVVIKGINNVLMFESEKDYRKYLDILENFKQECDFEIFAYCLMPNHIHLLIRHGDSTTLQNIFRHINTTYACWFNIKYNRTGALQNNRYYSEPIEDQNYLLTALMYIHLNPYKAGIESTIGASYPWSSYHEYVNASPDLVNTDFIMVNFDSIRQFVQAHIDYIEQSDCKCIDIDKLHSRLTDNDALNIIREISHCNSITDFQNLSIVKRNEYILKIHKKGVSIRQMNRLTGTSRGIISKILLNK